MKECHRETLQSIDEDSHLSGTVGIFCGKSHRMVSERQEIVIDVSFKEMVKKKENQNNTTTTHFVRVVFAY